MAQYVKVPLDVSPVSALLYSLCLSAGYVGSLYIWRGPFRHLRDHPTTITQRSISVTGVSFASIALVAYLYSPSADSRLSFWRVLGLHNPLTSLASAAASLGLYVVLFAGPVTQQVLLGKCNPMYRARRLLVKIRRLTWWRNIIVGPATEELVFRSCLIPILLAGGWSLKKVIYLSPLFFSLAHAHHVIHRPDQYLAVLFQVAYTWLFGAINAGIYVQTGYFLAAFAGHAFCNGIGFPRAHIFPERWKTELVSFMYLAGVCGYLLFIFKVPLSTFFHPYFTESLVQ